MCDFDERFLYSTAGARHVIPLKFHSGLSSFRVIPNNVHCTLLFDVV